MIRNNKTNVTTKIFTNKIKKKTFALVRTWISFFFFFIETLLLTKNGLELIQILIMIK